MVSKNEESSIGKVFCDGELSNQMHQTSFEFVVEKILGSFVDKVRNYYLNKFLIKIVCWLLWEFSKDETIGPFLPNIVHVKAVVEKKCIYILVILQQRLDFVVWTWVNH